MLNDEVEEYLSRNDIIIVPVGTVEMHGGFPLDSETTIRHLHWRWQRRVTGWY